MKRLFILLCLLFLPFAASAQSELMLIVSDDVTGYAENSIVVQAPFPGLLTLRLQDGHNLYRTMVEPVLAGENTLTWDGLAENQEKLQTGPYTLSALLESEEGDRAVASVVINVSRCKQALLFALPSSGILYLEDDDWFAEVRLVRKGRVVIECYRAEDMSVPLDTVSKSVDGDSFYRYSWNGRADGKRLEPGQYVLRFYAKDNPAYVWDVPVTIAQGSAPQPPLSVTAPVTPQRSMSDEEIWTLMMQPVAVADVAPTNHIYLRSEPGGKEKVGEVHGQSQALHVLEIREDGYVRVGAWRHEDGAYTEGYVPANQLKMVTPNTAYGLLVDKQKQTMTVYRQGKAIGTMPISTGLVAKDRLIRETPAGAYVTLTHQDDFGSEGYRYEYVIRYDGGNLLHQLGYKRDGNRWDFSEQEALLGVKASHGCIRLPQQVYDGLNAYWVWANIPYHTKILILDDPVQREAEASLIAGVIKDVRPIEPPVLQEGETELVLTLGGDVVLGTREAWWDKWESLPSYLDRHGYAYPFSGLWDIFARDDMTYVNLECVLKADASGEDKSKAWRFRGLPEYARVLPIASIELVNIANNHYIDYGAAGKEATLQALQEAGVAYSGFSQTYIWEQNGYKIGFCGCRETTYKSDPEVILRDITQLRKDGCDVIIYSCHWGKEYSATHNDLQEEMALSAMKAGADVVVGGHPHVVQGVDTAGHTLVLWSLGNLMFGGTHGNEMKTYDAVLAQLRLRFDAQGYMGCVLELIPILTSSSGQEGVNDFCPQVAQGEDRKRILEKIQFDTEFTLMERMFFPAK